MNILKKIEYHLTKLFLGHYRTAIYLLINMIGLIFSDGQLTELMTIIGPVTAFSGLLKRQLLPRSEGK